MFDNLPYGDKKYDDCEVAIKAALPSPPQIKNHASEIAARNLQNDRVSNPMLYYDASHARTVRGGLN